MQAPFPDLVQRNFLPPAPDTVWYGDVTYIWIKNKFWYLATVIDAATKELLGWAFEDHMRTDLVSAALHAAVHRRGGKIRKGVIFHSDRGAQYTSYEYGLVCRMYKIRQSMGRRGVCYDNAGAESFFSTIKLRSSTGIIGMTRRFFGFICSTGSRAGIIVAGRTRVSGCAHRTRRTATTTNK